MNGMSLPQKWCFCHYAGWLMHKIFFAAQQKVSFVQKPLNNRRSSFKLLIYLDFFSAVYLLSKPVGALIFKAWRCAR
jgi:hypothetical protein